MNKSILLSIVILFLGKADLFSQDCDSLLGYSKDDKYSIYLTKMLSGTVVNNPSDIKHGVICKTNFFKTSYSKGINLMFYFVRCGKMMDASVKVKIEFMDGSVIYLPHSIYDKENEAGMFNFIAGGDYGNIYELTLLRTKSIAKISVSGNQIDSYTYDVEFSKSLEFMTGMNCLYNLLN